MKTGQGNKTRGPPSNPPTTRPPPKVPWCVPLSALTRLHYAASSLHAARTKDPLTPAEKRPVFFAPFYF